MGDVANNLWRLAGVLDQGTQDELQHKSKLADIGIQRAQIGLQSNIQKGNLEAEIAKRKREQWLDEPVTIGQAIDTHPKWDPEQKKVVKATIAGKHRDSILNYPTTRRKLNEALKTVNDNQRKMDEAKATKDYRDKSISIQQQRLDAAKASSNKDEYKLSQQMDDLRGEYNTAIETLKDEYGSISDKPMQRKISAAYRKDKRLIRKKETPHYLDDLMSSEDKRQAAGVPPLPEGAILIP